jgi:hypothetical protein
MTVVDLPQEDYNYLAEKVLEKQISEGIRKNKFLVE